MFAALIKSNKGALTKATELGTTDEDTKTSNEDLDSLLVHSKQNHQAQQKQRTSGTTTTNKATPLSSQQPSATLSPELTQVFQPVEWDPEIYGVGVRSIDEQHQQLIVTITKLCALGKAVALNKLVPQQSVVPGNGAPSPQSPTSSPKKQTFGAKDKLSNSVTSPMSLRGALGLEMKHFEDSGGDPQAMMMREKSSGRRRSTIAGADGENGEDPSNDDYNRIKAANHVFGHRVTLAEGACRTIDRGHPPDFQKGGRIEPLITSLVVHCSSRLIQEEHALEAVSFSDRGPHGAEHQIFVREAFRAHQMMESYNFEMSDLVKLIKFLKGWIKDHIPKDRRYAPLMLEKQSSLAAGKVV